MGADYQIILAWMDDHIVYGHGGQVVLERNPITTAIDRDPDTALGTDKQKIRITWVLRQCTDMLILGKVSSDRDPAAAEIDAFHEIRTEIVVFVVRRCNIDRVAIVHRQNDAPHQG